jgi:glycosyltransferase involved in cell wall biosynthesis
MTCATPVVDSRRNPQRDPLGVLMVGNFLSSSGQNRSVCEELADRLSAAGWAVCTTSTLPGKIARLADMMRTVWRRRHQYDVAQVDVFSGPAFLWAEAACAALRMAGKPYVLTLHGGKLPEYAARWPRRVRHLLRRAAAVTTPSRYLFEQLAPYRTGMVLLPNPIDVASYEFRLRIRPQPSLVWLRAFHCVYNPVQAVTVLAALRRENPAARLVMVGPDKRDGSLPEVRQAAETMGVSDCLSLPGGVSKRDVPRWLNQGDIFLNTTNADNTPISVLEAMACGLCVVSTSAGGIPYLLEHGKDALLTTPGQADEMIACVRRLFAEPGLGEALSRNARAKAESFDWSLALPRWEALLQSIHVASR